VSGAGWVQRQVWLLVDGTLPLEQGLAQAAIRLVWTGHSVTVVISVPRPGWTLNARLAERLHREHTAQLRRRHDELAAGLRAGLGEGPCPAFDGGGRIQVCWTTRPRPRPAQWLRGLLRRRKPVADTPLQHFTGLPLAGMPPRAPTPAPPRARNHHPVHPAHQRTSTTTSRHRS
jgi:hypothetical protein